MKQRAKLLALLSVCLAAAVPVLSAGAAGAADAEWNAASGDVGLTESVEVGERYMLGDVLSIPENSLTVGDTEYPAVGILHSPSGIARTGDSVVLDETGVYTLEYTAVADGRSYSAETEFLVCDELYSVSGRNSSAEWAHLDYARDREGIVARVVNGDRFEYNGVIDLTGKTKDDSLITLCVLPEVLGTADAANFAFTFTDVYDPNNYVTVTTKKVVPADEGAWWAQCNSYVTANAAGQTPTGIELNGSGETLWEGNRYLLHRNDRFGACVRFPCPAPPVTTRTIRREVSSKAISARRRCRFPLITKNGGCMSTGRSSSISTTRCFSATCAGTDSRRGNVISPYPPRSITPIR